MKVQKSISFSLSFLVVGLPILFIFREYIPISKSIFTYSLVGFMLLALINYNNLFKIKIHANIPIFIIILLFILYTLFILNLMYVTSSTSTIYIIITVFIYFALLTNEDKDFSIFYKYILIISSFVTVFTLVSTPLDYSYWIMNGGRLYVGDTKNPNLSSFIALANILAIIFYLYTSTEKLKFIIKFIFLIVGLGSIYIYFLSFSKSAILGLIFALIYLIPKNFLKNKKMIISLIVLFVLIFLLSLFFSDIANQISGKFTILINAFDGYFYGKTENISVDSAAIRHQSLVKVLPILEEINLFTGNGIFTTRADFPLLQVFTDLGFFAGFLNLFLMFIFPLILISKQNIKHKVLSNDFEKSKYFSILLYLYNLPNLFLHGTPYEYSMWLPVLILYKFIPWKKEEKYA
jgi:hypothetical protein